MFLTTKGLEYSGWVGPAPFCVMRYFNDPQCLEGDRIELKSAGIETRKPNGKNEASRKMSGESFDMRKLLQVVVLRSIMVGKELLADCGEKFVF